MEIAYQNDFKDKGHHCGTFLIRCMDFRFHKALEDNLDKIIGEESCSFDSPGVGGGGSKSVIDESSREVLFGALDIAVEKHGVSRVVIADHIDCGAYGGSGQFECPEEERDFHLEKLNQAKKIVLEKYSQLEVVLLYMDWESIESV